MRHRFRRVPAPLALLLACLTHVTTSLAGIPPIEIRLAVARAERGDSKALDTLTAYTPSDEDSALQASIGRVQVLALLDRVDALGEIAQSGDGDVARRARLELAKLHLRKNAEPLARPILEELASGAQSDETTCAARKLLLDQLWWHEEYQAYQQTGDLHRDAGCPCDETELKQGYIALRISADLDTAAGHFERAAAGESPEAREAEAAATWVAILRDASNGTKSPAEARAEFVNLLRQTQGGAVRTIVAPQLARRTLALARILRAVNPTGALAVLESLPDDPVFQAYGAQAIVQAAEWKGEGAESAQARLAAEQAALALKKTAATAMSARDWDRAITLHREAATNFGTTAEGRDARLRLGYALSAGGKRTEAIAAFEAALTANADLGWNHPFNLEALFRLKSYEHGSFYMLASDPLDDPSADPDLAHHLDGVAQRLRQWREAAPADSPDAPIALLEEGGVLFEQAMSLKSPEAWDRVRAFLSTEVATHPTATGDTRATARLMILESYYRQENYAAVGPLYEELLRDFPTQWKAIGTAAVFAGEAARFTGHWQEGDAIFRRASELVPPDAETFASLNFHARLVFNEAWAIRFSNQEEKVTMLREYAELKAPGDPILKGNWRWAQ